jgi:hypothetical protein
MQVDFKELKRIVDETVLTEVKCVQTLHSLLAKENELLHNPVLDKVIVVLEKWSVTPPIEILKELEEFKEQN